jgi:hypothetical protein
MGGHGGLVDRSRFGSLPQPANLSLPGCQRPWTGLPPRAWVGSKARDAPKQPR